MVKITLPKREKISNMRVLLKSKVFKNKHANQNAEQNFSILYAHTNGKVGIALGFDSHWKCEDIARQYASPGKYLHSTIFSGFYNKLTNHAYRVPIP